MIWRGFDRVAWTNNFDESVSWEAVLADKDFDTVAVVKETLAKSILKESLTVPGLSPNEINIRLDMLTPGERKTILADVDLLQAGGKGVFTRSCWLFFW